MTKVLVPLPHGTLHAKRFFLLTLRSPKGSRKKQPTLTDLRRNAQRILGPPVPFPAMDGRTTAWSRTTQAVTPTKFGRKEKNQTKKSENDAVTGVRFDQR